MWPRPPSSPCRELDEGGSDNGNSTRIRKCLAGDPKNRPGILDNFGLPKHCFKSVSTASTTRRRSGPGRTYLAQIDVSLRAVGRETLTLLGNSRATAAVTLLLLLLYSAPAARTKSPPLSIARRSSSHANCLLSSCWVSARVCSHSPVAPPSPPAWLGIFLYSTLAWLSGSGSAYRHSRQYSHASRIHFYTYSAVASTLSLVV